MSKKWYSVRAAVRAEGDQAAEAEVYIYGDIGESWWDETVTARQFVKDIAALDVERLVVRINSVGGSVPDGIAIYNALRRHPAQVTVSIDGMAMSIASLIAMAGDTVEMAENAILMIHAPWTYAAGNSAELRERADMLDKWAEAMATSYAAKTGKSAEDMLALLTDGVDHYYTAAEASADGFVDAVVSALPIAASAVIPATALARYPSAAARQLSVNPAAAAAQTQEPFMDPKKDNPAAEPQAADEKAVTAKVRAAEKQRREAVRAEFAPFIAKGIEGLQPVMDACLDDPEVTAEAACKKILAHMAKDVQPVNATHVETVEDEADKRRDSIVAAVLARAGVGTRADRERAQASGYRGHKMLDIARDCLARAGIRHEHMDQRQIVAAAFTQSTSDFPVLLENAMHKTLQAAYATAPDTWSRFCRTGSVSDFRDHPRYRVGSLGNLDALNELGEYQNKTIPDGEKANVRARTKGNIINLSREAIINDDLGAFLGLADMLGRAAKRTVEADVYALLALNGGLGPTMLDGHPLFHARAGGNNIGAQSLLTVEGLDADRVLMASQTDVGGNDFLDLRPAVLVVPVGLGGLARVINSAQYDPDTSGKLQRPNMVNGLFQGIVDTPRLSGTRRYLFADPNEAPVIEVVFLDGNQEPYLESETGFTVDGTRWKVRLDFGVGAVDYRGAVTNAGTAGGG